MRQDAAAFLHVTVKFKHHERTILIIPQPQKSAFLKNRQNSGAFASSWLVLKGKNELNHKQRHISQIACVLKVNTYVRIVSLVHKRTAEGAFESRRV
jgi:hypothetical protein